MFVLPVRPRYLPAGIWLQVTDFMESPMWQEAMPFVKNPREVDGVPPKPFFSHVLA